MKNLKKSVWFVGTLVLMLTGHTFAMEQAIEEESQAKALFYRGQMLLRGEGCKQDYALARDHLEKAAAPNNGKEIVASACLALGKLWHYGWGVKKDDQQALNYFKKAFERFGMKRKEGRLRDSAFAFQCTLEARSELFAQTPPFGKRRSSKDSACSWCQS